LTITKKQVKLSSSILNLFLSLALPREQLRLTRSEKKKENLRRES
jgi:hypothetical protein